MNEFQITTILVGGLIIAIIIIMVYCWRLACEEDKNPSGHYWDFGDVDY